MQRGAVFDRLVHLLAQGFQRIFRGERPQRGAFIQRIAYFYLAKRLAKFRQKRLSDVLMQDKPLGGSTHLAGVIQPRLDADFHRAIEVGIVEHHKHIVAAEFQGRFLNMLRRLRRHHAAGFFRPGQRRALHTVVGDNLRHLILRDKQIGPRPFRCAGLAHQMGKGLRAVRYDAGVFGDNRVTGRQVWRQDAHQLVIGEVPRLHRQ